MSPHRTVRAVAVLLCTTLLACVTPRGELPAPPTDADLRSDGSAAGKAAVLKRYGVRAQRRDFMATVEAGDAVRPRALGNILGLGMLPEVRRYLESDAAAAALMPSAAWGWAALAALGVAAVAAPLWVATELAALAVVMRDGGFSAAAPPSGSARTAHDAAITFLEFSAPPVVAVVLLGVGGAAVMHWWQGRCEEQAVSAFNADLARRVDAAAVVAPPR